MAKDELSLYEKEVIQKHFGDKEFFAALDHLLYIERNRWEARMKSHAKAGAETVDPVSRLLIINEAAAKAAIYENFFVAVNSRTQVKAAEPTDTIQDAG